MKATHDQRLNGEVNTVSLINEPLAPEEPKCESATGAGYAALVQALSHGVRAERARSLHALLCVVLMNTQALLARLEAGVTVLRDQQREIVRSLYVATRHQLQALAAVLELDGLE